MSLRYLGRRARIADQVPRGIARIYAVLPYRLRDVSLRGPRQCRPGEVLRMEVSLGAEGGRIGLHCVHLAVQGPSGQEVPHYAQNLLLPGGRGKAGIPFAYNEEPGTWTVTAREVLTGRTARWRVGCRSR